MPLVFLTKKATDGVKVTAALPRLKKGALIKRRNSAHHGKTTRR